MSAAGNDQAATDALPDLLAKVKAGEALDATGIKISGGAVKALIEAAPKLGERSVLRKASFQGATFVGPVSFRGVIFQGSSYFAKAIFEDVVSFTGATFAGYAGFGAATFDGVADFDHVTFERRAAFQDTTWRSRAYFIEATFEDDARFEGPTFFAEDARFDMAKFKGNLFAPATYGADVWFDRAVFEAARHFGPLKAVGRVIIDGAVFMQRATVVVRAESLSAAGTEFRSGADIYVQSAAVALDGAAFGAPSTLSPATRDTTYGALLSDADYETQTIPRLVSLQGARVAGLALYGVDLRACRFRGAHGLDSLQLEQAQFAETPTGWQKAKRWPLPIRWTRRLAIAEEHRWRAEGQHASGWWPDELRVRPATPNWREPDPPTPDQVAAVYRALRKAQEERKDEPGAADFYYGEMEMRRATRHAGGPSSTGQSASPSSKALPLDSRARQGSRRRTPVGEMVVLFLYWLTSGYGMRASRALIALGVTITCGALLLAEFGFERRAPYWRSLLFAVESSVSLLRAPELSLTASGELVTIALRLLGPLFFGLTLLSLRGRVKR